MENEYKSTNLNKRKRIRKDFKIFVEIKLTEMFFRNVKIIWTCKFHLGAKIKKKHENDWHLWQLK